MCSHAICCVCSRGCVLLRPFFAVVSGSSCSFRHDLARRAERTAEDVRPNAVARGGRSGGISDARARGGGVSIRANGRGGRGSSGGSGRGGERGSGNLGKVAVSGYMSGSEEDEEEEETPKRRVIPGFYYDEEAEVDDIFLFLFCHTFPPLISRFFHGVVILCSV